MPDQETAAELFFCFRLTKEADAKGHPTYEEIQQHLKHGYVVGDLKQVSEGGATTVSVVLRKAK